MRAQVFTSPLEVSIYVEGLRARPALFVGLLLIAHAAIWTAVAWLANPGLEPKLAIELALGREWELGYANTPPLAPWLLDVAWRAGGIVAVHALGPAMVAIAGWLVYMLARRIAGDRHGAIAVFLMVGVHPVAFPVGAFDSDLVQMPLFALAVLAWWFAVADRERAWWVVLGVVLGIMSYAGVQFFFLFVTVLLMTFAMREGRAALQENPQQIAATAGLFVFTLLLTPRMISLRRQDFTGVVENLALPSTEIAHLSPPALASTVILGHIGLIVLVALASRYRAADGDIAPVFMRAPIDPFARRVAMIVALVPPLLALAAALAYRRDFPASAAAPLLLYSGLLVVVLIGDALRMHRQRLVAVAALTLLCLPPLLELATAYASPYFGLGRAANWPAAEAARYITNVYRTRTGRPLAFIVGSELPASAIAAASPGRPRVFIDANPVRAPWTSRAEIEREGAVVVWEIRGADAAPPKSLAQLLPDLVPESPLVLRPARAGALDYVRIGWAIIPPGK
jgi:hypothetical protein